MATSSTPLVGGDDEPRGGTGPLFDPASPRAGKGAAPPSSLSAWACDSLSKTLSSRYMRASLVYVL